MANVYMPDEVDVSKIAYVVPKINDGLAKFISMNIDRQPIRIQLPEMSAPFGLNQSSFEGAPEKYSLNLSFKGMETRPKIKAFYDKIQEIEEKVKQDALVNSYQWLKKKYDDIKVIEAIYTPQIKMFKDKETGEVSDKFPPTFQVKAPKKDGKFMFDVVDTKDNPVDIESVETKGASFTTIIQCLGLWIAGGKFGCNWKIIALKMKSGATSNKIEFRQTDEDDNDDLNSDSDDASLLETTNRDASISETVAEKLVVDDEHVESSDEEDNLETKPVMVKKPVVARKTIAKK